MSDPTPFIMDQAVFLRDACHDQTMPGKSLFAYNIRYLERFARISDAAPKFICYRLGQEFHAIHFREHRMLASLPQGIETDVHFWDPHPFCPLGALG